jgi:hypothetical protein
MQHKLFRTRGEALAYSRNFSDYVRGLGRDEWSVTIKWSSTWSSTRQWALEIPESVISQYETFDAIWISANWFSIAGQLGDDLNAAVGHALRLTRLTRLDW